MSAADAAAEAEAQDRRTPPPGTGPAPAAAPRRARSGRRRRRSVAGCARPRRRPRSISSAEPAGSVSGSRTRASPSWSAPTPTRPRSRRTRPTWAASAFVGDLTEPEEFLEHLEGWGISSVDLVAGGPPCQPFSRAGQSKIRSLVRDGIASVQDPRAQLWRSFVAVVEHLRPRAVLVENVPDLPSWNEGAVLISLHESLRELGYTVDARILDAFNHGVPQHRARLFLVGLRDGARMSWPRATAQRADAADGDRRPAAGAPGAAPGGAPIPGAAHGAPAAPAPRDAARAEPGRSTITSPATCGPTTTRPSSCWERARPTRIFPSACSATAATSSPTSTSAWRGTSSAARSPPTWPRTATGTSIPSSTGRSRCARRRGSRPSPTAFASPASRRCDSSRSATRCPRCSPRRSAGELRRGPRDGPPTASSRPPIRTSSASG